MNARPAGSIHPLRKALRATLVVALLSGAWVFRDPLFRANFGVVDPGKVYRSAQPTGNLASVIRKYQLRSVLNLRGGTEADPWYVAEVCTTHREDVAFYDLPLSAVRRPTREELLALVEILESCPYPLLIHCKWGSDRTGLASGLYQMLVLGKSPREARAMFSLRHGHFPVGGPEDLHAPFFEYEAWLERQKLEHSPQQLRHWIEREYRDDTVRPISPARPGLPPRIADSRAPRD